MRISSYKLSPQLRAELGYAHKKPRPTFNFKLPKVTSLPWKSIGVTVLVFGLIVGTYTGIKKVYNNIAVKNEQAAVVAKQEYASRLADIRVEVAAKGTDAFSYATLSQGFLKSGDAERAVVAAELATEKDPTWRDGFTNLGQIYLSVNQFEKAKATLQTALLKDPLNGEAHYLLSLVDQELRDPNGATQELAKAKLYGFDTEIGG